MKALAEQINELDGVGIYGRVVGVRGLMVEVAGPLHAMSVGLGLAPSRARSPAFSPSWSMATTITSRSPTTCAAFSTAMS